MFLPKAHARFRMRTAIAISLLFAIAAAVFSVYKVSLAPPSLRSRDLEIGAASTAVLIDAPHTLILNLSATSYDFESLQARGVLLGNLMATDPVKQYIARLAGIAPTQLQADSPITSNVPQTLIEPGSGAAATDIIASPDHYKLQIQADPEVPILHIYTQAPSAAAAERLANASVQGLRDYLAQLAVTEKVGNTGQVRLEQLGMSGGVVNSGVAIQIAFLTFITAFAIACCATIAASRVRLGWKLAGQTMPTSP